MRYDELGLAAATTEAPTSEEEGEHNLGEPELRRLAFFAEHPDLADPIIWALPRLGLGRGGGR